jgi:hypothetical protein
MEVEPACKDQETADRMSDYSPKGGECPKGRTAKLVPRPSSVGRVSLSGSEDEYHDLAESQEVGSR